MIYHGHWRREQKQTQEQKQTYSRSINAHRHAAHPIEHAKVDDILNMNTSIDTIPRQESLDGEIVERQIEPDILEWQNLRRFSNKPQTSGSPLCDLPVEFTNGILDHLFGFRAAASARVIPGRSKVLRGWGTALRHSRRREVSSWPSCPSMEKSYTRAII
ncbi:hypothetical protein EYC84_006523 [Monilinia fructicola]|uniref:Uncharacterized protein n=1 Tax=Monilinia fructicola TaxID=38448 RepID=A0A5M9K8K7_MONFR|nr:hypothetical protein EYC84_006523 [Monilinia fructicola]